MAASSGLTATGHSPPSSSSLAAARLTVTGAPRFSQAPTGAVGFAEALADAGIASLRYDKRASGPHAIENVTKLIGKVSMRSHLDELVAAVGVLVAQDFVDAACIVGFGNSEGTLHVSPLLEAWSGDERGRAPGNWSLSRVDRAGEKGGHLCGVEFECRGCDSQMRAASARTGLCYVKSHLLAALLRAEGIPTGLCYQRLDLCRSGLPTSID